MCKHEHFAEEDFDPVIPAAHPADECDDPWEHFETCDVCGGDAVPLGSLGRLSWYRCVDCGTDFSVKAW